MFSNKHLILYTFLAFGPTTIIYSMISLDDVIKDWNIVIHHPQITGQTQDSWGNTVLHHFFSSKRLCIGSSTPDHNDEYILRCLLVKGASFDMQNNVGDTPIHVGIRAKNFELLSYCFAHKHINLKQLNKPNNEIFTPLDLACQQRPPHQAMIAEIIQRGGIRLASICQGQCNVYDEKMIKNFAIVKNLHQSALSGDFEAIKKGFTENSLLFHSLYLPEQDHVTFPEYKGINLLNSTVGGINTLYSKNRHAEIVQFLLNLKIQSTLVDEYGNLPIHRAAAYGECNVLEQLLAYNAFGINKPNMYGWAPLHLMALKSENNFRRESIEKIIVLLLAYGADINQQDSKGKTPLFLATEKGNSATVELLLKKGARSDIADNEGNYPLHLAASGESVFSDTIFSLLIVSNHKLLDAKNHAGFTPAQEIEKGRTIEKHWNSFERNDRCAKNKLLLQQYRNAKNK